MPASLDRRRFLRLAASSAATLGLSGLVVRAAPAADKVTAADPIAQALGYVEDAAAAKDPGFKPGSHCQICQLYTKAQESGGFAPCGALAGKLVSAKGWCKAFTPM